ncbi:MAG: DUF1440 domain-containing protein [Pseudomonadota bacterium]|nr:DUF1440 domain-containing protein [Pseudomonadota bacterium]
MGRYTSGGVGRDVLAGAIAGGAAVWLISKMDWSLSHAGRKSSAPASGLDPAHAAAGKAATAVGVNVGNPRDNAAGHTVYYGIGIGAGALYGLLRGMAPSVTTGRGAVFGIANFIIGDEIGAPAMGLAKGPLDYAARDHAKSALAHIVFGVLTDLGTRLLSPWKDEVVVLHGPSLHERLDGSRQALSDGRDYLYEQGRTVLDQGRDYLGRGRELAGEYAEQARETVEDWDLPKRAKQGRKRARKLAERLRANLPDADDLQDAVDQGRERARRFAGTVGSRLPDRDDLDDVVETGRKRSRSLAKAAASRLPDRDDMGDVLDEGRSRARGWFRSLMNRLPSRDDVEEVVEQGRSRGRKIRKRARDQMPDRDDVKDTVADGRKRVNRLASDAGERGETAIDKAFRWLFG